ncbi:MAG: tetratricopeptide repeat protein, partial [Bacteroidales bacterium]|nr:tetratricopeptide repeat protein [Bacteroidales bacterium]
IAEGETPEEELSPADLIDRFIMISPNMERMSPKEYQPVQDITEQDSDEPDKFITETLAKIYINQGYYTRAINIYEKLTLQYPEKSAYFANRIEKIKDLIK